MAKVICKKKGHGVFIELSGDATMSNAAKIRDFFLNAVVHGEPSECHIDLGKISGIDLSFLEMLVSFRMSMIREKKRILFEKLPDDHLFIRFMTRAGVRHDFFFGQRGSYGI